MSNDTLDSKVLADVANDYSSYLKIDFSNDVAMVRQNVEDTLTRLEEFQSVLEMVQNEAGTEQVKQSLLAKSGELDAICGRVDQLEAFVQRVDRDVTVVETLMQRAEVDLKVNDRLGTAGSALHKLLPTFFKKKEASVAGGSASQVAPFEPPEIFKTSDYFPPKTEEAS